MSLWTWNLKILVVWTFNRWTKWERENIKNIFFVPQRWMKHQLIKINISSPYTVSVVELAQRDRRTIWEDPESWINSLSEREDKGVEGVGPVLHIIESCTSLIAVQQDTHTAWVGIFQHRLDAVVPCWKLHVKPLHTPGFCITPQAASGTLAVDSSVCKAQSTEVVTAHFDLPVMTALRETLCAEHLGTDRKAKGDIWIVRRVIRDCRFGVVFSQGNPLVSCSEIKIEDSAI